MTQAEHKALVAGYFDQVLTGGEVATLDDLLTPDFRSWLPDGGSVGSGPYRDAVLASRRAFPDLGVTVLDQVAEGDGAHRNSLLLLTEIPRVSQPVAMPV